MKQWMNWVLISCVAPMMAMAEIAQTADDVAPLQVGDKAPDVQLIRMDGGTIGIAEAYKEVPLVLVFFRGGWCPYCTKHLNAIGKVIPDLVELGYQVIAISPDSEESIREGTTKVDQGILLAQDKDFAAVEAFGLGFALDDETLKKYESYDISPRARESDGAHILPVPAVFVVDQQGIIQFVHYDPNYKKRLSPKDILAAAKKASEK